MAKPIHPDEVCDAEGAFGEKRADFLRQEGRQHP